MSLKKTALKIFLVFLIMISSFSFVFAEEENIKMAERLMAFQLEALKSKDLTKFIENGNKAFREIMDEYTFDSFIMQRHDKISKGYQLEYLGCIRSIGTLQYLWKIHITDDKYQLLGRLSLSQGRVIGFGLE